MHAITNGLMCTFSKLFNLLFHWLTSVFPMESWGDSCLKRRCAHFQNCLTCYFIGWHQFFLWNLEEILAWRGGGGYERSFTHCWWKWCCFLCTPYSFLSWSCFSLYYICPSGKENEANVSLEPVFNVSTH